MARLKKRAANKQIKAMTFPQVILKETGRKLVQLLPKSINVFPPARRE